MAFHNTVRNGFRCLAVALMVAGSCWFAPSAAVAGMLTEGNILVSYEQTSSPNSPRILSEYSLGGQLAQSFSTPYPVAPIPGAEHPRDVVVTPDGLAHVYNGTGDPFLSTLNPLDGSWTHRTHPGWSTVNNGTYGGIAATGPYIFTTDMDTGQGDDNLMGVIRFDMVSGTSLRFADTIEPFDLTIGMDGLLYVQYPGGSFSGSSLEVYDPNTLEHIRHIFFGLADAHRAVAVSGSGEIYLANSNGDIERYSPNATLISEINVCSVSPGRCLLSDIDIAPDGTIIAGTSRGRIIVTDLNLSNPHLFAAALPDEVLFVTFVPEPGSIGLLALCVFMIRKRRPRCVSLPS